VVNAVRGERARLAPPKRLPCLRVAASAKARREGAAGRTINAIRERAPHVELRAFMHSVPMDRERVRNLALSSSYVKHGVADIPAFLHALEALLDATSPHGPVDMRYTTRAIAWRVHG